MSRSIAICLALFVTLLWSTSYILNKWAFAEGIGPLTLAGLRYALAAITLGAVRLSMGRRPAPVTRPTLWQFAGLGVAGYVVAQGFQYLGQYHVTPTQASMVLSVGNTLLVLVAGALWLGERPGGRQSAGIAIAVAGVLLYYHPWTLGRENVLGIVMILLSGVGYAIQLTANRSLVGRGGVPALDLVLYPMLVGAGGMLLFGVLLEPWPVFTAKLLWLLLWLGPVNGAAAFYLWTYSQRGLQAFESSVLNNSMLLQIAGLDALFLGRTLGPGQLASLLLAGAGIMLVQSASRKVAPQGHVRGS